MKIKMKITVLLIILISVSSCLTTGKYAGPRSFVPFRSSEKISTSQQMTLDPDKNELVTSFEHEFTYDSEGNLIKTKETEYFDRSSSNPRFVVWETEWKVLGGMAIPYQASVNGSVFCTLEYEILDTDSSGIIYKDAVSAFYYKKIPTLTLGNITRYYDIALANYPVPFIPDDMLISPIEVFDYNRGYSIANVLNMGFDNIVLKKYNYSYDKLYSGFSKSLSYGSLSSSIMRELARGENVDYSFTWEFIAGKPCMTKIDFTDSDDDSIISQMEVIISYNKSGDRTEEEWAVISNSGSKPKRVVVFKQEIGY